MFSSRGSLRGSRGACFAQLLMKNLPATPELTEPHKYPSALSTPEGPGKDIFDQQVKNTFKPAVDLKPKVSPKMLIDKYMQGETHAVSLLHQLAKILQFHMEIKETVTTGNVPGLYFAFCVVIDGVEYKTGMGTTKKNAKLKAAELALQDLLPTLESGKSGLPEASDAPPLLPVREEPSISDVYPCRANHERRNCVNLQIPHAVRDQLTKLMSSHLEFSACAGTTAAFIIQTSSGCEVVALGTGDFNTKECGSTSGRIMHDSHAAVTARRSLMRLAANIILLDFCDSCCSDIRGMEMSVSQRVEGITSQLPMFYCMMRPHISLAPSVATNSSDGGQLTYGINWSEGDSSLEVVDGLQGKTIEESPFKSGSALASRLCKAAMLHRFKLVAKEAQRQDLLATSSYREAKRMAKPYQEAKTILRTYLSQQGFGSWLVKRSVGENFSM
nr:PREDICTED: adenosine deaminase domain-containing protein 1 [Paralichthys olivaceus]